jgi:peptidoglycan/LPS O-acetylase OafA/YrhL
MPELDGLRALSILGVITAHMHSDVWHWLYGGRGVFVFFVLSGYLITRLGLLEESKRGGVSFKAFYARRAFRLLPAYYLVLGAYCVLILLLGFNPEKRDLLVSALPFFLLYMSDIPGILGIHGRLVDLPFGHSWSLGIEEKFYLIFPLLTFGVLRANRKFRTPLTAALMLFFMATPFFGLGAVGTLLYPYSNILIGCLLALLLNDQKAFGYMQKLGGMWCANALLIGFLVVQFSFQEDTGINVLTHYVAVMRSVYAIAVTLLLSAVLLGRWWLKSALGWSPLVFIGKISYGVYLIHRLCLNPVEDLLGSDGGGVAISILSYVLASALSIAAAYVMFVLLERPCIRIGHAWSRRIQGASK